MKRFTTMLLPLLLPACIGSVQRSARVPHPAVPNSTGQPMSSVADFSIGASSVTDLVKPGVGDATQAVEVPGTQARAELRLRPTTNSFISLVHEHGFAGSSQKPDPTQATVGEGEVLGYGTTFGSSIATSSPNWRVGWVAEIMMWDVPYVEYQILEGGSYTYVEHGSDTVGTIGLGVSPSYKSGQFTAFGGVFARNHPTTQRKEFGAILDNGGDVTEGPMNVLLDAGIAYDFTPTLTGSAIINQNVTANPVKYGPGVQFAITAKLGN
jgi:hypothetical protein